VQLIVSMRAEALLARLTGGQERLMANLRSVVNRLSIEVQTSVKEDKLTGQALSVRTGTLRRSINRVVTESQDSVIATVGTNVKYAAVHEYGFDGDVTVKAHTRTSVLGNEVNVRSFTRHMHMPERSFLRSTLKARETEIRETLRGAILQAVRP
jgi:phage gpG-like protein